MRSETVEQTKAHILEVAREQFFKKGFAATSINTLVDAANVTKPTVYYHFKNKEGLFAALVEDAYEQAREQRRQAVDETATAAEQILQAIRADFAFCLAQPDLARFVLSLTFALPNEQNVDLKQAHQRDYEFFSQIIERGIRRGEMVCQDVVSAALALQGAIAINVMSFLQMNHAPDFLDAKRAAAVAKTFLEGISGAAQSKQKRARKSRTNQNY